MKYKKIISLLGLALILSSCANDKDDKPKDSKMDSEMEILSSDENSKENSSSKIDDDISTDKEIMQTDTIQFATDPSIRVSPQDALARAKKDFENLKVKSIAFDHEDGQFVYHMEIISNNKAYTLNIDPISASIFDLEEDDDLDFDDDYLDEKLFEKIIDYIEMAKNDAKDYEAMEWELEKDDGKSLLEVSLERANKEIEYTINADDGSIIKKDK